MARRLGASGAWKGRGGGREERGHGRGTILFAIPLAGYLGEQAWSYLAFPFFPLPYKLDLTRDPDVEARHLKHGTLQFQPGAEEAARLEFHAVPARSGGILGVGSTQASLHAHISVCMYVYIYRARERKYMCMYVYLHVYTHAEHGDLYLYIYVYLLGCSCSHVCIYA